MNTEERLRYLAEELAKLSDDEKAIKKQREEFRKDFFRLIRDRQKHNPMRPVRQVEVPLEFFERTGLSKEEFVETRFPGWEVEHVERNIALDRIVFVLKRSAEYMPEEVALDDVVVSKSVVEYTPEIDWMTLAQDRPDLFEKLAKPVTSYTVDEDEFERMMHESPEDLAILRRHMSVKKPSEKLNIRKVKDERSKVAEE